MQDGDGRTKAAQDLAQFQPDVRATHHDQMVRAFSQGQKPGIIERRDGVDPRNRRQEGPCAGIQIDLARQQDLVADHDAQAAIRLAPVEAAPAMDYA